MTITYEKKFKAFISPISGGRFISQVACMQELFKAQLINNNGKYNGSEDHPDIMLGSSGGNFSNYAALSGNFTECGILKSVLKIKSDMFIRSWATSAFDFLPSWLGGVFNGNYYDRGYGGKNLFKSIFNEITITNVEIWTGTYDEKNKQSKFFCNLDSSKSLINPYFFMNEEHMYGSAPLEFLDGNIELIADAVLASASIPLVVKGKEINGEIYSDGGCCYPSPISVFSNEISRIVLNRNKLTNSNKLLEDANGNIFESVNNVSNNSIYIIDKNDSVKLSNNSIIKSIRPLRLYYFCPYEMGESKVNEDRPIGIPLGIRVFSQVMNSNMLNDKNAAIRTLRSVSEEREVMYSSYYNMNTLKLCQILKILETKLHYLIIFSPHGSPQVDIFNLKKEETIEEINKVRENYTVEIYYCNY